MWAVIVGVAFINVLTGFIYFQRSSDPEENRFFSSLKQIRHLQEDRSANEEIKMATFISNLANPDNKILIDDAAAYKIMAHIRSLKDVIMPINNNFITVVENYPAQTRYVCIAKPNNKLRNFTVLNDYNLKLQQDMKRFSAIIMYQTENWAIYKILPPQS